MRSLIALGSLVLLVSASVAQEGDRERKTIELVDSAGKEITLKNWKFTSGTKYLTWLDSGVAEKGKKASTPRLDLDCLEFRETKAIMYKDDVTTFIPLLSIKQIVYDAKAKAVGVDLLDPEGKNLTLRGSTEYTGINKFNIDGELDGSTLNVSGPVKLQDGFLRTGIRAIRFPQAFPVGKPAGPTFVVVVRGKDAVKHAVHDLQPLYKVGNSYRLRPALQFQKSINVEWSDIQRMTHLPPKSKKGGSLDFEVEKKDGAKQGMTLLDKASFTEKETATFVGLVGRVPVGYRLFPATIIAEMRRE